MEPMTREAATLLVRSQPRMCAGPRGSDGVRTGCGSQFLNDVILQYPFDGAEHEYECPRCGNEGTFRSPVIELVE